MRRLRDIVRRAGWKGFGGRGQQPHKEQEARALAEVEERTQRILARLAALGVEIEVVQRGR